MQRLGAIAIGAICLGLAGCATGSGLPVSASENVRIEGYLADGVGLRLYATAAARDARNGSDCIQVLRPLPLQVVPAPRGRVRVSGRLSVFDNIFDLAKLNIGVDHATHELCESRYLILDEADGLLELE